MSQTKHGSCDLGDCGKWVKIKLVVETLDSFGKDCKYYGDLFFRQQIMEINSEFSLVEITLDWQKIRKESYIQTKKGSSNLCNCGNCKISRPHYTFISKLLQRKN